MQLLLQFSFIHVQASLKTREYSLNKYAAIELITLKNIKITL